MAFPRPSKNGNEKKKEKKEKKGNLFFSVHAFVKCLVLKNIFQRACLVYEPFIGYDV